MFQPLMLKHFTQHIEEYPRTIDKIFRAEI